MSPMIHTSRRSTPSPIPPPLLLLLQCAAVGSWAEVLGAHQAELSAGVRDEDWGAQQAAGGGGWTLVEVVSPSRA